MFNQDITIVNKRLNKTTKKPDYVINHVKGFWSSQDGVSISNVQLVKSDSIKVIIMASEPGYVSPKEFQDNKDGWTLQNDDYLIKGIVNNFNVIADLKDNYECMKITKFAIKDYGSSDMQHFEINGE